MSSVSWSGWVWRWAVVAAVVGLAGGCAFEGRTSGPSGSTEPTDTVAEDPDFMTVTQYCAENPGKVSGVRAEVTAEGVALRWSDRGVGNTYYVDRRPVGSQEWAPVAYVKIPRSELRYVDTVPRFGQTVEYRIRNGSQCEDESGANLVTVPWTDGEDGTGGRPEYCEVWATPITDVTAQLVAGGVVEVTWRDTEDPPPGTAYVIYSRAPGAQEWYHEEGWVRYLADDAEPLSFWLSLSDNATYGVGATYGVSRAAVCDPETLDGATAEVTDQVAEQN